MNSTDPAWGKGETNIRLTRFWLRTNDGCEFVDALEELCKRFAVDNDSANFVFEWREE